MLDSIIVETAIGSHSVMAQRVGNRLFLRALRDAGLHPHKGWRLFYTDEADGERFTTPAYTAVRDDGLARIVHASPFHFTPTQDRFAWLVDHGFPMAAFGNWFDADLDAAMAMQVAA